MPCLFTAPRQEFLHCSKCEFRFGHYDRKTGRAIPSNDSLKDTSNDSLKDALNDSLKDVTKPVKQVRLSQNTADASTVGRPNVRHEKSD